MNIREKFHLGSLLDFLIFFLCSMITLGAIIFNFLFFPPRIHFGGLIRIIYFQFGMIATGLFGSILTITLHILTFKNRVQSLTTIVIITSFVFYLGGWALGTIIIPFLWGNHARDPEWIAKTVLLPFLALLLVSLRRAPRSFSVGVAFYCLIPCSVAFGYFLMPIFIALQTTRRLIRTTFLVNVLFAVFAWIEITRQSYVSLSG